MNKIMKMLKYVRTAQTKDWRTVSSIQIALEKGEAKLISFSDDRRWSYLKYKEEDIKKRETWSTFENLRTADFYISKSGKLCVKVSVGEGRSLSGEFDGPRFTANIELPNSFCKNIKDVVEGEFEYEMMREYREFLEKAEEVWKKKRSAEILGLTK